MRQKKDELTTKIHKELNITHVVDPLKEKPINVTDFSYFRLHGLPGYNLRYKYTDEDLRNLKKIVEEYENPYVFFNNLSMCEDAFRFKKIV